MRSIAIMNNKGGVGKTVTAINLADLLVRDHGKRVLLVDCDGQKNLTEFHLLPDYNEGDHAGTAELLVDKGETSWSDFTVPLDRFPGLSIIPASSDLYDLDLSSAQCGQTNPMRFKQFADQVRADKEFDYLIFDCPPGFTLSSVAALMASDEVIIPLTVDGFSIRGLETMRKQLQRVRTSGAREVNILITQWARTNAVQAGEALLRQSGLPVFNSVIPRNVIVASSTMTVPGAPLAEFAPKSKALMAYRDLTDEVLEVG